MAALIIGVWIVRISSHRASGVDTVPEFSARWRFPAGGHRVAVTWPEGSTGLGVAEAARERALFEAIGTTQGRGQQPSVPTRRRCGIPPTCTVAATCDQRRLKRSATGCRRHLTRCAVEPGARRRHEELFQGNRLQPHVGATSKSRGQS